MTLSPLTSLVVRGRAAELDRRLEAAPESEPLVAALRATGQQLAADVLPREQFRDDLRTRLMAVAAVQAAPAEQAPVAVPSAVSWRVRSRAGGVAAGAMAAVVAVAGIAVAGSRSLPGDPFYGVKRQVESFSLRAADGDVARGTRHLGHATTRLREVGGLVRGRDQLSAPAPSASGIRLVAASSPTGVVLLGAPVAERVRQTLGDMDTATLRGQELLTEVFRSTGARGPLQLMGQWALEQGDGIEELLPALPPASRDRARTSLALVEGVAADADELLAADCGPACDPTGGGPSAPASGAPASVPSGGTGTSPAGTTGPTTSGRPAQRSGDPVPEPGRPGEEPERFVPDPPSPVPRSSGETASVPRTDPPGTVQPAPPPTTVEPEPKPEPELKPKPKPKPVEPAPLPGGQPLTGRNTAVPAVPGESGQAVPAVPAVPRTTSGDLR